MRPLRGLCCRIDISPLLLISDSLGWWLNDEDVGGLMITYEFSSFNDRFEALAMVDVTEVDDKADTPDKATACVASIRIVE
jgi:hypothetical protein